MESATAMPVPLPLRGVAAIPLKPCILQAALGRNHLLLLGTKNASRPRRLSCKATGGRRDVLLGLGGAAAASLPTPSSSLNGGALAAPIQAPDLGNCHPPDDLPDTAPDVNCCPTYRPGTAIVDFKPPPASSPLRVRPAAHLVDKEYLAKYEKAVALMKALPDHDEDPRSFAQQWHVHCAYCDGAYDQVGFPDLEVEIHNCWLFFPWHRLYLYFHERILGKLIGDDTFALPFWNWDAPGGMTLPAIYVRESSPLYDERRSRATLLTSHRSRWTSTTMAPTRPPQPQELSRSMTTSRSCTVRAIYLAGVIESVPHGTVHVLTGDPRQPNTEDMGNFYYSARDPVFFSHHGNIDRLWRVWNGLRRGNTGFTDPDWLDAGFLFYDEEARLVRARVRDCLDTAALRYAYQDVGLPWLDFKPSMEAGSPAPAAGALPATLSQTVRVAVARPEEVLVVEGIEVADHSRFVKFDVFVNETQRGAAGTSAAAARCAGSVALTPHGVRPGTAMGSVKTAARFGICDLLDDIGADGDSTIVVSLVPRCAGDTVTVGGVRIEYVK
ncbi:hypothetical protein U9M48_033878 [Paspalum notatum var. saurae]|uniref:Tyrosinase copper-binding domain-containing protein n=1 Tax=Paspalum notatum var. saurae TaxID=547442 RepID=A0AAQ3U9C5_PASNO